jgi:hypothetical protein
MRVESGKKLVAYMGDDRRGGHTYKFVSKGTVTSPKTKTIVLYLRTVLCMLLVTILLLIPPQVQVQGPQVQASGFHWS